MIGYIIVAYKYTNKYKRVQKELEVIKMQQTSYVKLIMHLDGFVKVMEQLKHNQNALFELNHAIIEYIKIKFGDEIARFEKMEHKPLDAVDVDKDMEELLRKAKDILGNDNDSGV